MTKPLPFLFSALLLFALPGCDKVVDRSAALASITKQATADSLSFWDDALTYHPAQSPNAPQTRYCYTMMSDVVCYDSVQPRLTAKLVGYQDGENISWVQPGGGSLGASGGDPVAYGNGKARKLQSISVSSPMENRTVERITTTAGEIQSNNLPAR